VFGDLGSILGSVSGTDWLKLGGNLLGSALRSDAAGDAADRQSAAAQQAMDLQKRMYEEGVARNSDYLKGGTAAFNALLGKLGVAGDPTSAGYGTLGKVPTAQDVMNEPGYEFGRSQSMQALQNAMNAKGMSYSGAALKAAGRYANDYATTKYDGAFNRSQAGQQQAYNQLQGVANMGQASANNTNAMGQQYGTQYGNNLIGSAGVQGAADVGQANIWTNALNQGISQYGNRKKAPESGTFIENDPYAPWWKG
jgi:hypothetical protein